MNDSTEDYRRLMVEVINDPASDRQVLEARYGKVWNTDELRQDFEITGFMAPYVVAKDKKTGKTGSLTFQHSPRIYFDWSAD